MKLRDSSGCNSNHTEVPVASCKDQGWLIGGVIVFFDLIFCGLENLPINLIAIFVQVVDVVCELLSALFFVANELLDPEGSLA